MRAWLPPAILALVPALAAADEGEFTVGIAGGPLITDPLEILGPGITVVPRVGYEFRENALVELDLGVAFGQTRGIEVGYLALSPRVNFRGILIDEVIAERDPETNRVTRYKRAPIQPFLVAGVGGLYKSVSDEDALAISITNPDLDLIVNGGPGVQIPIGNTLMLRTDYRIVANFGTERFGNHGDTLVNWEWTVGLDLVLGGAKDSDGDGVVDKEDACVTEPEDVDEFEDTDGCPDPDNDGDGVLDGEDTCPNDAEDMDEHEDADGCPDPDNDGDGVLDADDRCVAVAGVASAAGCPDADADGIQDEDDACPELAGTAEHDGCPDTDGDGVVDPEDECPEDPHPEGSFGCADADGDLVPDLRDECPDQKANEGINPRRSNGCPSRVFVTDAGITITETVFFDTGRATIQRRSNSLLDDVAATLLRYEGITKVEIQGHTDDQGDDAANLTLSQQRAEAVVAYLVGKGVDAGRLEAKGYGETQPVADNATADGRAQNRRVQFQILEQAPTTRIRERGPRRERGGLQR